MTDTEFTQDPGARPIRFGAAYYPEYQRRPDLAEDLRLMAAAGFDVIRVGESVWSTWEPEDGRFETDWLEPVLDAAHAHGIGAILGTPTYALPMWLARRHPEVAGESATGQRIGWGGRQEMDFTHPAYRWYAERIIRVVVERYRDHPAIIGYQVDNEPGLRLLHNEGIFQRFVDSLRTRYGDVETLNREWGLTYWSHRLSTWADLWRPDGNQQPQYDLAWRRFQADLVTEFIGWQADLVRDLSRDGQFVTTCVSMEQSAVEDVDLGAQLDILSGNAYYDMGDSLTNPSPVPAARGPMGWIVRGPWAVTHLADLMWSSRQAPFLVTETNAGSIGNSATAMSPYPGQWRQAAWLLVSRGARMVSYWHWNTLPYGAETHWVGVLPHSGRPGRVYAELASLGADLTKAGAAFAGAEPEFDIAVLWDCDSKFALTTQGPLGAPGGTVDPDSYRRIVQPFCRGITETGRQQRLVRAQHLLPSRGGTLSPQEAAAAYPVLLVAGLYLTAPDDLTFLEAYAAAGGHLVLGPRTAYADREGRPWADPAPAHLHRAARAWYAESATLARPVAVVAQDFSVANDFCGAMTDYAELLVVGPPTAPGGPSTTTEGAQVLARLDHPHYGTFAAMTTAPHGAGRVTLVGGIPDEDLARSLARWLAPHRISGWPELPPAVTDMTSRTPDGRQVHVLHNWSWTPTTVSATTPFDDLLGGMAIAPGDPIRLGPWDVRVLLAG